MPLTASDFPIEVQMAFFIFSLLSDRWEGMSGTYMGKDWAPITCLLDTYKVDDPDIVLYFLKMYESTVINHRAKKAAAKTKREAGKQQGGKQKYTHNIKG